MKFIRIHYLDASAIVKLLLNEPGSTELRQYFGRESNFTATSICFAEALGVLKVKRFNQSSMTDEEYFSACEELMAYVADGNIEIEDIELMDRSVFNEVEKLTRTHNQGKPKKRQ